MARRNRACAAGVAQHLIQRGNNRQPCFGGTEDFSAYAHWLREAAERFRVAVHAPVRAAMVSGPADYRWSSYRANALGIDSGLCTPREIYWSLGQGADRLAAYRALFAAHVDDEPIVDIREATRRGHALDDEHFIREMEACTGTRLRTGKSGPKPTDKMGDGASDAIVENESLL